ncbi:4-oxalomesaconate tautomerase [Amycolatopsis bartoniae]|uniref:FldA protein n=1 Tax=Amycolatopsis bartoniae TaxID=941986 RepID=A0A8H9IYJ4_9PSEU|nr:4-oxalomesaconate tautomerase [Amycolatopsis bartoniae]MBB2934440.1 4-oxalomesaconate tautomerase [Amycolatopsis bartoniae]GHF47350.1 FldA protein [Amycolatopsis bartoniae]
MTGVPCLLMRGGTSKGAYFLADDLPADRAERDDLLLRIMGSPDPRQIDGIGGAHPLTSKVAVVSPAADGKSDVDYLFLQLGVEEPTVSDRQNCGNLLAGVGPFAVERGLVRPGNEKTSVRIHMVNSDSVAVATFPTPGGVVRYDGDTAISGVPGTAAAITLDFADTEGSATGSLLPTGNVRDEIDGIEVTCVDNGMPVVVAYAKDFGVTGYESVAELAGLRERVQSLRLQAGKLMGLGDVSEASVPKTTLVAAPRDGGTICTRTFIPLEVHTSIGVLGAVTVGTAVMMEGAVGHDLAHITGNRLDIEHPTGHLEVEVELDGTRVRRSGVVRTARKLFEGTVFPR